MEPFTVKLVSTDVASVSLSEPARCEFWALRFLAATAKVEKKISGFCLISYTKIDKQHKN